MKTYACFDCGSVDVFIDDRGNQKALMCGDCGKWLKWISKAELPLVERYINSESQSVGVIRGIMDIEDKDFRQVLNDIKEGEVWQSDFTSIELVDGCIKISKVESVPLYDRYKLVKR